MKRLERLSRALRLARRFGPEVTHHRRGLFVVAGASLLATGLALARPWPIAWIFDLALVPVAAGEADSPLRTVVLGTLAALGIAGGLALVEYWRSVRMAEIGHDFTRQLRTRIFGHLAQLPPSFHSSHKTGDLLVRLMGDVPLVRTMVIDSTIELSTRLLLALGVMAMLFVLDPLLAAAVLLAGPLLLYSTRLMTKRLTVAIRKQRSKEGQLADFLHEAISGSEVVQSLGGASHVVRRFKRNNRTSVRAGLKAARLASALSAIVEGQLGLALAIAVGLGSWRVLEGALSPGELLAFLSYTRGLLKPVRGAARHAERIARGTAGAERVLHVLDQRSGLREARDAALPPARPERIVISDLHYRYATGYEALAGVNLSLQRGELVALVGRNGAGKSTLAMLMARLEDPSSGKITIDGLNLDRYQLEPLRRRVGLVLQQSVLFGESLRENLLLAAPEATDEQLLEALATADGLELVQDLPEGLDTVLGSSGKGLSGGQMRRLCLARTLLGDPGVIIVDEPFAGLDRPGVERVLECLRNLANDRIVVVIAHDLADLSSFDRIIWLENGRVEDQGRHQELVSRAPRYREVLRAAAGGEL
ncbi:ABC transporter ATP-binding protein [Engelhardtia mirabilis]|uniref:Multidrug export ATP-binding/permease protein n=1 Tax=Engelhardtia mirabilis TaxID=2528011 RepID=A0A518BDL7_9BACT|nr:Putative multidrug export ATP-binding/permease protein [Planctomycetes bacterium Pla133]QDU99407.1 Putative multidrug export ATP-binding/permease protein [Planctomycetes bacterium Pla86]